MRKDVQEALENAIAGFEKRQQVEQERLRERERFETDWAQIRTTVVLPALEEVAGRADGSVTMGMSHGNRTT
jgi:hypothetical protein